MMMALGQFVFSIDTLAYQELQRQTDWRHASNSRVGDRPARQYIGPGDDSFTLSGMLAPEFRGSSSSLDQLREMGADGNAYALVNGVGEVFGAWVIEGMGESGSIFIKEGKARKTEFTITLQRVDDERANPDGGLDPGAPGDWWQWWL